MEAIEYIRKIKCVSAKDSVSGLKLDIQQVIRLMDGYHRELVKNNIDLATVTYCAKCGKEGDGYGIRGELCKECDHIMRLDAM